MGLSTPSSMPPECPGCCAALPANLNGSIEMDPFGLKNITFVKDGAFPCEFAATVIPPFGGVGVVFAHFCAVDDTLKLLVGAGLDPAELPGNHCNLPAEGVTALGWTVKIWE